MPENALKRSVLRLIDTESETVQSGAGIGRDCAILSFGEDMGTAFCMQEGPVSWEGEPPEGRTALEPAVTIGSLIQRCANNLAAGGAEPIGAQVALLLPETAQEADVRTLMAEAEAECKKLNMEIIGGQTRVTKGAASVLAVVAGVGLVRDKDFAGGRLSPDGKADAAGRKPQPEKAEAAGRRPEAERDKKEKTAGETVRRGLCPGQDVVLSKWIGLEGTALLARRYREKLLERYPAYLVEEAEGFGRYLSVVPEARIAAGFGVSAMHDASEGGILGALWELAEGGGAGLSVDLRRLPLRQETVEVCEHCGANPYELLSGGCLIMVTEDGPGLVAALEREHIPAVLAGKVTDSNDRILINGDEIRYMDRPKQDAVYGTLGGPGATT